MSIKSDRWIRRMAASHGMIEPFEPGQVRVAGGEPTAFTADWHFGQGEPITGVCAQTATVLRGSGESRILKTSRLLPPRLVLDMVDRAHANGWDRRACCAVGEAK
mgnify:CR=1 FL=1